MSICIVCGRSANQKRAYKPVRAWWYVRRALIGWVYRHLFNDRGVYIPIQPREAEYKTWETQPILHNKREFRYTHTTENPRKLVWKRIFCAVQCVTWIKRQCAMLKFHPFAQTLPLHIYERYVHAFILHFHRLTHANCWVCCTYNFLVETYF